MSDNNNMSDSQNTLENGKPERKELKRDNENNVCECFICDQPLGQDSKDEGFLVCHTHRKCTKCDLNVRSAEAKWCYENDYPIAHAACLTLKMQKEQVPVTLINLAVNLISVDMDLSVESNQRNGEIQVNELVAFMDHDRLYYLMRKMQAECAAISFILSKDRTKIEKSINERERKKFTEVQEQRAQKTYTKSDKKADKKHGMEGMTPQEKAIRLLMKNLFIPRDEAEKVYAQARQKQ